MTVLLINEQVTRGDWCLSHLITHVRMRERQHISRFRVYLVPFLKQQATRRNACDFREIKLTEIEKSRLLLRVNRANIMATPTNSNGNLVDEFEEAFQVKYSNFNFYSGTCAFLAMKICVYKLYICYYLRREKYRGTLASIIFVKFYISNEYTN